MTQLIFKRAPASRPPANGATTDSDVLADAFSSAAS
jgi:hypothetical protein